MYRCVGRQRFVPTVRCSDRCASRKLCVRSSALVTLRRTGVFSNAAAAEARYGGPCASHLVRHMTTESVSLSLPALVAAAFVGPALSCEPVSSQFPSGEEAPAEAEREQGGDGQGSALATTWSSGDHASQESESLSLFLGKPYREYYEAKAKKARR